MSAPEPLVELKDVHLSFGHNAVLRGIDIAVHPGQAVSIIGPSGSGKSTILRCVTGLRLYSPRCNSPQCMCTTG